VIDAHAASRERVRECIADFAGARPRNFGLITLTVGDEKFDADFAIRDGGKHAIRLRGDSLDDQRFRRAFASSGPSNLPPPFVLDLTLGPAYQDTQANLSWLRTAYLARFAVGGYPFIFNPALDVVRRQILRPDQFLLGGRFISAYGNDSLTQKVICNVKKPLVVASPGVKIGPYTVLLPPPGADTTFYARMEQEKPAGQFTADAWAWPKEPSFGMQSESRA
jgi:hypothetical protein